LPMRNRCASPSCMRITARSALAEGSHACWIVSRANQSQISYT